MTATQRRTASLIGIAAAAPAIAAAQVPGTAGGGLWSIIGLGAVADLFFAIIAAVALWSALRLGDYAYAQGLKAKFTVLSRWADCRERIESTAIAAAVFHGARVVALAILFGLLLG